MAKSAGDKYIVDSEDGLRTEAVGVWSLEKHDRLRKYVDITRKTRAKFGNSGATYIDLYCGPGRVQVRGEDGYRDGSPLLAARESEKELGFTTIHIADLDKTNVDACCKRLERMKVKSSVVGYCGKAEETAKSIVAKLNPNGLHLAFLDPYSLGALPFSIIQTLASVKRMDMILHVSEMDLNRNIRLYKESGVLEAFAPGCVSAIDWRKKDEVVRSEVFRYWKALLEGLTYHVGGAERVSGDKNQPFYWLVSVSRHDLGKKFWNEVRQVDPQRGFDF